MTRTVRAGRAARLAAAAALMLASLPAPGFAQDSSTPAASPPSDAPVASSTASEAPADSGWTGTELPGAMAITATADRFVAVGSDGTFPGRAHAWTSTDGVTWEPATLTDAAEGTVMNAVTQTAGGGLIAVGTATSEGADGPDQVAAWYSPDGQAWAPASIRRPANRPLSVGVNHVADGPGGSIALARYFAQDIGPSRLYRTVDGQAWARIPLPEGEDVAWSSLTAIPDGYLLIGNTFRGRPRTFRSTDGEDWERVREAPRLLDAATAPDGTIVGINGAAIVTTSDLVAWEEIEEWPEADPDADTPALDFVTWDGTRFGVSGVTYDGCPEGVDECYQRWLRTSPDGTTWTESTGPDGEPGPDAATQLADIATLGDATVVLGSVGPGPSAAWIMEE